MTAAWGHGLATTATSGAGAGTVLDTWFPTPKLGSRPSAVDPYIAPADFESWVGDDPRREVSVDYLNVAIDTDAAPASTPDAYLRLHLLSHLLVAPNTINLDGIFGHLPIVAWTTAGPMLPEAFARLRPALQRAGISAHGIDKFPRLLDYVVPDRVRIADASRVRLGAHLSPGTSTVTLVPAVTYSPASTTESSPIEMPTPEFAPSRARSPIATRCVPPPERVPMIEAPPPTSEPSPTTTPCEMRPSTMEAPSVPAL